MKFDIIKPARNEQWAAKETFKDILIDGEMSKISGGGSCGLYINCRTKLITCIPVTCYHLETGDTCGWNYYKPGTIKP